MTAAEMLAAGHDQASVSRFMAEHDINGDGKLSASEILTLHTHTEAEARPRLDLGSISARSRSGTREQQETRARQGEESAEGRKGGREGSTALLA